MSDVYLLLDKENNHIRRFSEKQFSYDFENEYIKWKKIKIPNETILSLKEKYPPLQLKLIDINNKDKGEKWFSVSENKWYKVKIKKHHSQKWDEETQTIKNIIEDYPENFNEEIL